MLLLWFTPPHHRGKDCREGNTRSKKAKIGGAECDLSDIWGQHWLGCTAIIISCTFEKLIIALKVKNVGHTIILNFKN